MNEVLDAPDLGPPDSRRCPECGTPFRRALVRFDFDSQFFGYFPADVCGNDHRYLTQESSQAIEQQAVRRGLWAVETPAFGPGGGVVDIHRGLPLLVDFGESPAAGGESRRRTRAVPDNGTTQEPFRVASA